ncbi:MAG: hypothetical protein WED05_02500 [Candidatus Atabeyarchaeum deiterrae]
MTSVTLDDGTHGSAVGEHLLELRGRDMVRVDTTGNGAGRKDSSKLWGTPEGARPLGNLLGNLSA